MHDLRRHQLSSGLWVPLSTVRQRLGSMVFASRAIDPYPAEDREFMQHVARNVAIAVENALALSRSTNCGASKKKKFISRRRFAAEYRFDEIIGSSAALRHVLKQSRDPPRPPIPPS